MKISDTDDYWRLLAAHTSARLSNGAPWSVQSRVAALVGNHAITACFPQFTADQPTRWTVHAVTNDRRLIRLRMEFDAERHDREGEQIADRQNRSIVPVVHEAWVRRLSDVVSLEIGKVYRRLDGFGSPSREHFNLGDVRLKFNDGEVVDLGIDQTSMYDSDDHSRSDDLIEALRAHTGL